MSSQMVQVDAELIRGAPAASEEGQLGASVPRPRRVVRERPTPVEVDADTVGDAVAAARLAKGSPPVTKEI